jgi:hypothetical protein
MTVGMHHVLGGATKMKKWVIQFGWIKKKHWHFDVCMDVVGLYNIF